MIFENKDLPFYSNITKNDLKKGGFVFGKLPFDCSLPNGWVEKRLGKTNVFGIFDERKRMRGKMYYRLSGTAELTMWCRYSITSCETADSKSFCIEDRATNQIVEGRFDLQGEANLWLDEHYPDYKDPFAYW